MNKFINKIYIKALVGANMAKNELQKMREEDEGLDIIITIILVAVGLVLVGILVNYAKKIVSTADSQVNQIGNTVGGLNANLAFCGVRFVSHGPCSYYGCDLWETKQINNIYEESQWNGSLRDAEQY